MRSEKDRQWVDSMPEAYERWLVPAVFQPFARDLARRIAAHRPGRVLELAAGTGVLTRELVQAVGARAVVATDLSSAMVEIGQRQVPHVRWHRSDASDLPFPSGEFDLVACQFGVMFFPEKRAAFDEVRRVLRTDGAFVFSTWAGLDAHEFQAALQAALLKAFPANPPTFLLSVPHGYADPEVVVRDLEAAGFHLLEVETVTLEGRADSAADLAKGYCTGTPLRTVVEADSAAITAVIVNEMEARLGNGAVTGRMTAHIVTATSPGQ